MWKTLSFASRCNLMEQSSFTALFCIEMPWSHEYRPNDMYVCIWWWSTSQVGLKWIGKILGYNIHPIHFNPNWLILYHHMHTYISYGLYSWNQGFSLWKEMRKMTIPLSSIVKQTQGFSHLNAFHMFSKLSNQILIK